MIYSLISLTLLVVTSIEADFIPSKETCSEIYKCYNPIKNECALLEECSKSNYCWTASCSAYPDAKCQMNRCGGCDTYFVDAFDQIIQDCDTDICTLTAEFGDCKGRMPRYYYNKDIQQCEEFFYSGCGGNANNFQTIDECEQLCSTEFCTLPADSGPCYAYMPRYFYNDTTDQCEIFIYGGCLGNANNFETLAECQQICDTVPDCVPINGGSFMGGLIDCYLMNITCNTDEKYWFDQTCGCGCRPKPDCEKLPYGWKLVRTPDQCLFVTYTCGPNEEMWSTECGCGCKPKGIYICPNDVKKCPDGSFVDRDRYNKCEFLTCPECDGAKCLIEPCKMSSCYNYPYATCENYYCDGCDALWFDSNGKDVTVYCEELTTSTVKPDCVLPDEWILVGTADICPILTYVCEDDEEPWTSSECGCGCKPKLTITTQKPHCVPDDWIFVGDPDLCTRILFFCGDNEDYWSKGDCGCGCKPKDIVNNDQKQCETGGCSGEICAENGKNIMTTCEWECEYGCRKLYKQCGRGIIGIDKCRWYFLNDKSEEGYNKCVEKCSGGKL
eukprot:402573_1